METKRRIFAIALVALLSYRPLARSAGDDQAGNRTVRIQNREVNNLIGFDTLFDVGRRLKVNQEFLINRSGGGANPWRLLVPSYEGDVNGYFHHLERHIAGLEIRHAGGSINSIYKVDEGVSPILDQAIPTRLKGIWNMPNLISELGNLVPSFKCALLPMDTPAFEPGPVDFEAGTTLRDILNATVEVRRSVWSAFICDRDGGMFPLKPELENHGVGWRVILMLRRSGK